MTALFLFGLPPGTRPEMGVASVYTDAEDSGDLACPLFGKRLVDHAMVAAHKTLPCGSVVTVTNLANGRRVQVTIVDRGPYKKGRVIDLTQGAARAIGCKGLCRVAITKS